MMKNQLAERILNLILEIVYLTSGEEYIVVKRPREHVTPSSSPHVSGGGSGSQSPNMEPPPLSPIHKRDSDQRILELTTKIIHLLTGEDWLCSVDDLQSDKDLLLCSPAPVLHQMLEITRRAKSALLAS
ncbi:oocyte zinc finger protein XlCOF29-like isoform X2 [Pseudophryne corroboree]|uniref:oocyte zinc finger protein XlCOF29-like isoform X2 n=1 Tax=Pseudophryne corroboree TaxID=495146 RepID=UPI003081640B